MSTYVLVHGAWHTGNEFKAVADTIKSKGHSVFAPTVRGNRSGDVKTTGLTDAIRSIVDYLQEHKLTDIVLVGHSYGGMVITGVADAVPERIRRLVYWNAFVPNDGEALVDLIPSHYVDLFKELAGASGDNSIVMPYPIWRDAFINDGDEAIAKSAYAVLNPHPYATFTDKIRLKSNPATWQCGKSYLNCTEDAALPHSMGWHPRLSEKLGLFRLVQTPGSHELVFTKPTLLAEKIIEAGRD